EDPAPMPELLDDPATPFFDESQCLPGNHGKTVSAVARGEFTYYARDEKGQKIGDPIDVEVRDAARSSCGKDFEGVDPEEDVALEEDVEVEKLEVEEIDEPESKGKPDHAGGKDKGKPDHAGGKDKGKPDHAGGKDKGKGKGKGGRG
ncbi:MAG TPA: hypothetical protein VK860_16905, partial [Ilumatobacteraceae bacterium]|nr:hypothetical protein [Ilumatobacteraceae bacterium]